MTGKGRDGKGESSWRKELLYGRGEGRDRLPNQYRSAEKYSAALRNSVEASKPSRSMMKRGVTPHGDAVKQEKRPPAVLWGKRCRLHVDQDRARANASKHHGDRHAGVEHVGVQL